MHYFARFMNGALSVFVAVTFLLVPVGAFAFPQPSIVISSGNATGANYAVSSAIAKIFNRKAADYGMRLTTTPSEGSLANIERVDVGSAAFGIAQSELLKHAANGTGLWRGEARKGLRAVLGLHLETVTIVAAADRDIKQFGDLKGKRVNIEAPGSSDNEYGKLLFALSGIDPADVTFSEHPAVHASEYLQSNKIDAYLYTVGHPNLSVLEASSGARKVLLVPLDKDFIARVTAEHPLLIPAVVPTSYYPNLECKGAVSTIGVRAVLFTRADMTDETVYRLVREVMTNFDLFRRQHPVLQELSLGEAAGVSAIPLHPGAARYFREAGLVP